MSYFRQSMRCKSSSFSSFMLRYGIPDDQALDRSWMNAVHALLYGKESSFHWVTLLQSGIITIYPFSVLYFSALLSFSFFYPQQTSHISLRKKYVIPQSLTNTFFLMFPVKKNFQKNNKR